MLQFPQKRPEEVLDYKFDWSRALDGDVIASSFITVSSGSLVIRTQGYDDTTSTVWVEAGEPGSECKLTCIITTIGGRTFEQVATLPIIGT